MVLGEKKRSRLRRSRYVETLSIKIISPNKPPKTTLDQPSISSDTDRNLDLGLRQTGSRSIDQPRSDPDSKNRRNYRSPQCRPTFKSAAPPREADRPYGLDLHHRYRFHLTSDRQLLHLHSQIPQTMTISIFLPTILEE